MVDILSVSSQLPFYQYHNILHAVITIINFDTTITCIPIVSPRDTLCQCHYGMRTIDTMTVSISPWNAYHQYHLSLTINMLIHNQVSFVIYDASCAFVYIVYPVLETWSTAFVLKVNKCRIYEYPFVKSIIQLRGLSTVIFSVIRWSKTGYKLAGFC